MTLDPDETSVASAETAVSADTDWLATEFIYQAVSEGAMLGVSNLRPMISVLWCSPQ
jgi:hypothetical protein